MTQQVSSVLTSFPPATPLDYSDLFAADVAIREYSAALARLDRDLQDAIIADPASLLQLVHPTTNSIGYLAVLSVALSALSTSPSSKPPPASVDRRVVLDATVEFLLRFDPQQVRYAGSSFLDLVERVLSGRLFSPLVTVEIVSHAILRLDPSGTMFTSNHLALVSLAYEHNCTEQVLDVINRDLTSYPVILKPSDARPLCDPSLPPTAYISTHTRLTREVKAADVMEYNLVCALIWISRRDWTKSLRALERVITHPTKDKGVSKIMTESYKKWLLVGLLDAGCEPTLPSHTSQSVKSACATLASPYMTIAQLFSGSDAAELKAEAEANSAVWEDDMNGSLIAEVLCAYQKWQIINMRQIYSQISLSQILTTTSSAETGKPLTGHAAVVSLIRSMIDSGMLSGELDVTQGSEDGYLKFNLDQDVLTENDFARGIAHSHHVITALGKEYRVANEHLGTDKEYLKHLVREQKWTDKETDGSAGNFETQVEDEDLMTGVVASG